MSNNDTLSSKTNARKRSLHGVIGPPKHLNGGSTAKVVQTSFIPQQHTLDEQNADTTLPSFTSSTTGVADDELYHSLGFEIQRATSAPPAMELSSNNIFSFQSKYSHLFGDIRCEADYESFYKAYPQQHKLPAPLDQTPMFWGDPSSVNDDSNGHQQNGDGLFQQFSNHKGSSLLNMYDDLPTDMQSLSLSSTGNSDLMNGSSKHLKQSQQQHVSIQDLENTAAAITGSEDSPLWPSASPNDVFALVQKASQQLLAVNTSTTDSSATNSVANAQALLQQALSTSVIPQSVSPLHSNGTVTSSEQQQGLMSTSTASSTGQQLPVTKPRSSSKYQSVSEVAGKIYGLAKDQHGCRFLQRKLEEGNVQDLDAIYNEVHNHIVDLMTDPFGNYLCQKLVEHCNDKQKSTIIGAVSPAVVKISMNMHGTRAVQKLIECLTASIHIQKIIDALRNAVVPLIKDLNGNHVIQRCLQRLTYHDKQFIYDAVAATCVEVATHKHGCCVMQRCIDHASDSQKMLLIREITVHALELVQDPFGNYVVQYVLDLGVEDVNTQVILKFLGSLCQLSMNKFSSNVMEKCLRISNLKTRGLMIEELCNHDIITQLIQDSYGNYVLQTALTVSDAKQYTVLSEMIKPLMHLVRNTPYGKKIESKLNKRPAAQQQQQHHSNSSSHRGGGHNRGRYPKKQ